MKTLISFKFFFVILLFFYPELIESTERYSEKTIFNNENNSLSLEPNDPSVANHEYLEDETFRANKNGEVRGRKTRIICEKGEKISIIQIYYDPARVVKGIRIYASNKNGETRLIGESGGFAYNYAQSDFRFQPREYLKGVIFEYGRYLDWISFITNRRESVGFGGPSDGSYYISKLEAPSWKKIIGFNIWSSNHDIEGIQLITDRLRE